MIHNMQRYIRVVSEAPTGTADDLRLVIDMLVASIPSTSEYASMSPHLKGGFSLFLEFPDDQLQHLLEKLTANGWMPCF